MRVGAALRALPGFDVQHGGTYTDGVTGKPRQFDFRCSVTRTSLGTPNTKLLLAVECKNLNPDYPLVVCGTERQDAEAFHELIFAKAAGVRYLQLGEGPSLTRRADGKRSFYPSGKFVGKSLVRLKPGPTKSSGPVAAPDADVYEKWAQALASGVGLAEMACNYDRDSQSVWSAVLPVVVVSDDSLWRVDYDGDGKMVAPPERVGECELYVSRPIEIGEPLHRFVFSHIHFLTLTAFKSFLSGLASPKEGGAWDTLFNPGLLRFGH